MVWIALREVALVVVVWVLAHRVLALVARLERHLHRHETPERAPDYDVVVIGGGRFASALVDRLAGRRVQAVDHNPVALLSDSHVAVLRPFQDAADSSLCRLFEP